MFGYMPLIEAAILTLLGLLAGKSLHLVPEFFHQRLDFMDLADFPHIFPYFPVIFLVKHIKTSIFPPFPLDFPGCLVLGSRTPPPPGPGPKRRTAAAGPPRRGSALGPGLFRGNLWIGC